MKVLLNIRFWDDGSAPHKELRIYDERGQSLGFGEVKLEDSVAEESNPQPDLFASTDSKVRSVTFLASLDVSKLAKLLEQASGE